MGFTRVQGESAEALSTLYSLERTIRERRAEADVEAADGAVPRGKLSWTRKLMADPALLCSKIRWGAPGDGCKRYATKKNKQKKWGKLGTFFYHHPQSSPLHSPLLNILPPPPPLPLSFRRRV